jgi:3-hydroxyacyl-CoA dehydrogenase
MEINRIMVAGPGFMGSGIAQEVLAMAEYTVGCCGCEGP